MPGRTFRIEALGRDLAQPASLRSLAVFAVALLISVLGFLISAKAAIATNYGGLGAIVLVAWACLEFLICMLVGRYAPTESQLRTRH